MAESTQQPARCTAVLSGLSPEQSTLAHAVESVLPAALRRRAQEEIKSWESYLRTPLHALPALAARLGIERAWCKDEGGRFGLGSFKALGGAYAVRDQLAKVGPGLTVACATEGNHGRSVAWAARKFGVRCVIYLHQNVSAARESAIAAFGAEIRRIRGTYDDAVLACASDAAKEGWTVISDTSWEGYEEIPASVMAGYSVLTRELVEQLRDEGKPTHVFLQGGVGGMAAAVIADLCDDFPLARTRYVVVEPRTAACLLASLKAGKSVKIEGAMDTVMAGLACGAPSPIALRIVAAGVSAALSISDDEVVAAMRMLARPRQPDPAIVAGASGAAGLAGLTALLRDPAACHSLGLGSGSRVLFINTERDTDPEAYAALIAASGT